MHDQKDEFADFVFFHDGYYLGTDYNSAFTGKGLLLDYSGLLRTYEQE